MKVKPLNDRVLVVRVEEEKQTAGGIIIPDTAKEKPQKAAADRLLNYIQERQSMICYPEFRSQGWQIGSGPTESRCKCLATISFPGWRQLEVPV